MVPLSSDTHIKHCPDSALISQQVSLKTTKLKPKPKWNLNLKLLCVHVCVATGHSWTWETHGSLDMATERGAKLKGSCTSHENILSRASEVGSPTNRPGSQGSFGPSTGGPDLQGSLLDKKIQKERTAHLIRLFFY